MIFSLYEETDLKALVEHLHDEWSFSISDDTYEAVATTILHAPPDMGRLDSEYIGNRVAKMLANQIAFNKLNEIKTKREQAATKTQEAADGSIQGPEVQEA
jgi:hypothetical protein